MATAITLTYFGFEGAGRTVTEAKKDAGRKIEQAFEGDYTPEVFAYRGHSYLVWRTPEGWCNRAVAGPDGPRDGKLYACANHGHDRRKDCVREVLSHLAQIAWVESDGQTPPAFLTDRDSLSDYRTWTEFQLRYADARRRGMDDHDAHSYAGRNPGRPELWREPAVA